MTNPQRLFSLFSTLASIDSPSYSESGVSAAVKAQLDDMGLPYTEDGAGAVIGGECGNLLCRVPGDESLPPLLFAVHMDTVEPCRGKKIITHGDGRITSDGTTILGADDCAGIAAILEAVRTLLDSGERHRPLELMFSVAEEPYCVGAKVFDYSLLRSREAYVFDLMGPVGKAANSAPTIISFRAEFTGKAAHAGFAPEGGIHAINAAARAINAMPSGRVGDATINVGTVSGGTARNIIPDKCEFTGEIRSLSDASAQALLSRAHEITKAAAQEFGAELNFVSADCVTAYATPTEHSVCRRFESACAALGLNADIAPTLGGSDNNCLAQHGIAGIVVANAMNDCHSCAESTEQAELVRAAELALQLMLSKE